MRSSASERTVATIVPPPSRKLPERDGRTLGWASGSLQLLGLIDREHVRAGTAPGREGSPQRRAERPRSAAARTKARQHTGQQQRRLARPRCARDRDDGSRGHPLQHRFGVGVAPEEHVGVVGAEGAQPGVGAERGAARAGDGAASSGSRRRTASSRAARRGTGSMPSSSASRSRAARRTASARPGDRRGNSRERRSPTGLRAAALRAAGARRPR